MEYEKLTYTNERGESVELSTESVYHCNVSKDVEGIAGVTNVVYSTNSMGQHGDTYVGQRIEARDIDILGHINTRDKAQAYELRRQLLKVLNPELDGTLSYEFGSFKRVINCRLHGEPKIERKKVLLEFSIPLECLNPFWREVEETKEDIASWVAAWHFPCVIEKDNPKSMIYGYRAESVIVDCYNEGDVSTGMRVRFVALGTVKNPILLNVDTGEFIKINVTMQTGDTIEVSTKYGSKGAKLIRDGVETDYFRYVDVDSTYMQLAIGDNNFRYDAESGVNSMEVSIFYKLDKSSGWLLSHNFKSPSFRLKCERKLKFLPYREWNCSYCFRDFKSCSIPSVDLDSSLNAAVIRCEIKVSISIINKTSFYFTQPIDRNDRLIFSLPALLSD